MLQALRAGNSEVFSSHSTKILQSAGKEQERLVSHLQIL